mmetsp:Transcript_40515/g.94131  ORF Transcript_40515/g.94131 Transcript_40515/m.94131 type:complete len:148 (+) Transcript_40515:244-687(+)
MQQTKEIRQLKLTAGGAHAASAGPRLREETIRQVLQDDSIATTKPLQPVTSVAAAPPAAGGAAAPSAAGDVVTLAAGEAPLAGAAVALADHAALPVDGAASLDEGAVEDTRNDTPQPLRASAHRTAGSTAAERWHATTGRADDDQSN